MGFFRSILVCVILGLSSYLGALFWQGPFLWLAFVSPKYFRIWMDFTVASWMTLATATLELVGGIRIRHFGDFFGSGERAVLLMNHRTRLDWFYLWSLLMRCHCLSQEKIVLKEGLNKIPGPGWAMQCAGFIFLRRRWEEDQVMVAEFINYFLALDHKCQILIFPEGTNLTEETKAKSNRFAEDNQLTQYEHVLHPRTTGFISIVQQLRKDGKLDAVYDITVAYPGNFPETEIEFVTGNQPDEVHFHVCRYGNDTLPLDEAGLAKWLSNSWADKEKDLDNFYTPGKKGTDGFQEGTHLCNSGTFYMGVTLVYWLVFLLLALHCVLFTSVGRVLFVLLNLAYVVVGYLTGGVDKMAVAALAARGDKRTV